jgi:hypothetical protein
MSCNAEFNELFGKKHKELTILAQQELPPKLWPNSNTKKLVMVNAILKNRRMPKLPSSFFGAAPASNASTSTASTVSSSSPARKKSKPTASATTEKSSDDDDDDYLLDTVCAATTASADLAPSLPLESFFSEAAVAAKPTAATNAKNDEAEDVASVSSGNAKNEEDEVEDFLYLFMEMYDKDEERKMPPPDPLWLQANMKQLELLKIMMNISKENAATLDKKCPLPSLIRKVAEWFNKLTDSEKKLLRTRNPPHPYVIFDPEDVRELYPGKSDKELEALSKEDLYKVKILAFCPTKEDGAGSLHSLVKGGNLSGLTGTHFIRNGFFLVDKWDPSKKGTKQLHEINIENKMESMKRIADIANLSLDMSKLKRSENIISRAKRSATNISKSDRSWNANFAMLVKYVGQHFKLPHCKDGPTAVNGKTKLGKWYSNERNKSHTTARGDRMLVMKEITSILYIGRGRHLRNLGPSVKNNVKKMISELKSLSPS